MKTRFKVSEKIFVHMFWIQISSLLAKVIILHLYGMFFELIPKPAVY